MNARPLTVNPRCGVRDRPCGNVFGGASLCFVASPAAEHVERELDIIRARAGDSQLEPYVAVDHYDPAMDIFCQKICTKIIEARVCVVILTEPEDAQGQTFPNPNVHYEYGLMTAWRKPTIPVQREDQTLAFNIRSLDTVKYSHSDFLQKFSHALRVKLTAIEEDLNGTADTSELHEVLRIYMELQGYSYMPRSQFVNDTKFIAFYGWMFALPITDRDTLDNLRFSTKLLCGRLEAYIANLTSQLEETNAMLTVEAANRQAVLGLQRRRAKAQSEIDAIRNAEIVLADWSGINLGQQMLGEVDTMDSTLRPAARLVSPQDISSEVQIS